MAEKDRFGDKLRDREKAEEDRYMAEQDRLRLEKLRAKTQTEQALKGVCPSCSVALEDSADAHVKARICPKCRGMWLEADALREFLSRAQEGEIVRFFRGLLE
jgi:hypothetical protein